MTVPPRRLAAHRGLTAGLILLSALGACTRPTTPDVIESFDAPTGDATTQDAVARDRTDPRADGADVRIARDANDAGDGAPLDGAGRDAADAGDAAVVLMDTGGTASDGSPCAETDPMPGALCTLDSECDPSTERCLATGCGVSRCEAAGRRCEDDSDCLAGFQQCTSGTCVATGEDCGDSRACALGFVCEVVTGGTRRCVDRRRPCANNVDCPYNAACIRAAGHSGFCAAVLSRCATDTACILASHCVDVDGDGERECIPAGECDMAACPDPMAPWCRIDPFDYIAQCGLVGGVCSTAAPCPAGYSCQDPWATGVTTCVVATASCYRQSDCIRARTVCFDHTLASDAGLGCH